MIFIKNGHIYTMAGQVIENGCILIKDGKIVEVGKDLKAPENAEIIDAKGKMVTPGFIDAHCHLGMFEEGIGFEGSDGNEMTDPITPQLRAIDAINPMDISFREAYEGGVTTAVTGPGSANVIGGTFAALKTYGHRVDDMVIKDPVAMMDKKENEDITKRPDYDMKMEAMIPVLKREIPVKAHAHRADDIFTALRIAKEFNIDITLDHCTEGHLIAEDLARAGKTAIVGPSFGSRSKFELQNKTFDTPGVLVKAGVKIAITTDSPVIPLQYLSLCAGLAHKAGLSEMEALKAITINAAEIVGLDHRIGSIEVGKDADIVIFKGNPIKDIDYKTFMTIIDGKIVYKMTTNS